VRLMQAGLISPSVILEQAPAKQNQDNKPE